MNKFINVGIDIEKHGLFEGQYKVPNGMAYNSYLLIEDNAVCLIDTVDKIATDRWLQNLDNALCGREIDYLVVSHAEPDHSYNIAILADRYPNMQIVATANCLKMISQFYQLPTQTKQIVVKDGDTLQCGIRTLKFYTAPMVHWPEVMLTYDEANKILFSADAFGRFGVSTKNDWLDAAREYYINIVGKFGIQTGAALKKLASLKIDYICPLHGNVISDNISYYINKYEIWSSYTPETNGVFIAYTTVYGNTESVAKKLHDILQKNNIKCVISNLSDSEMSQNIATAFQYSHIVLATTTYENSIFPAMNDFINHLMHKNFQNRKIGIIENGSWAPTAGKLIKEKLSSLKNIDFYEDIVTILSAPNEITWQKLDTLAQNLIDDLK